MSGVDEFIVAGGGIGGLATALALARAGRKIRVLERAPVFAESGYGLQLGPNAVRVLTALGIGTAIEASAVFPEAVVLIDAVTDRELVRVDLGPAFRARYRAPYLVIHRGDLLAALLESCRRESRIVLQADSAVLGFFDDGSAVQVRCESGREYRCAALIGADGLNSVVRAGLLNDGAPRALGHVAYRGVVPIARAPSALRRQCVVGYIGPGLHLVQYPLRGGAELNNVAVIVSDTYVAGATKYGGVDELRRRFDAAAAAVRSQLEFVAIDRCWPLYDRPPAAPWSRGRVTLIGDAAHPAVQYLAQGACMALEDAVVLARAVTDAPDLPEALRRYGQARARRTARVQLNARWFGDLCHAEGAARSVRNDLWREAQAARLERLDWLYRGIVLG